MTTLGSSKCQKQFSGSFGGKMFAGYDREIREKGVTNTTETMQLELDFVKQNQN